MYKYSIVQKVSTGRLSRSCTKGEKRSNTSVKGSSTAVIRTDFVPFLQKIMSYRKFCHA